MKSFHFSLEKIYELRIQEEKKVKLSYGELQKIVNQKEQEIQQMIHEKAAMNNMAQVSVEQMQVHYRYLARLDQKIMDEHQKLLICKQKLAGVLEEYATAQKERRIIEKLRQKQYQEYMNEMQIQEQKELDEFRVRKLTL